LGETKIGVNQSRSIQEKDLNRRNKIRKPSSCLEVGQLVQGNKTDLKLFL